MLTARRKRMVYERIGASMWRESAAAVRPFFITRSIVGAPEVSAAGAFMRARRTATQAVVGHTTDSAAPMT